MKPRLLDLFSGAGGAACGYQRAGFYVVGVDHKPQPRYVGDEFVQADALAFMRQFVSEIGTGPLTSLPITAGFDAIHASPPCQAFTRYQNRHGHIRDAPDLIEPTRALLRATGLPYVIENVEGAPLEEPALLCGSMFGLPLRRHRLFETNFPLLVPSCAHGWQRGLRLYPPATNRKNNRNTVEVGTWRIPMAVQEAAMEIDWMATSNREDRPKGGSDTFRSELSQAIPPAYTELIGHQLLSHVRARSAA